MKNIAYPTILLLLEFAAFLLYMIGAVGFALIFNLVFGK